MKKLFVLFIALAGITIISCRHFESNNTSISYSETDHYFSMRSYFGKAKTRNVEEYMDDRIGSGSNMSFVNTRIDGQLALDDHTTFYIKKHAGFLEIKLDKDKNSYASYEKIKSMCEGIKEVLAK